MISVIIPAYNEEEYIGKTLESLVRQKDAPPFEVIVVDNASTDGTSKVAHSFADRLKIRVIAEKRKGRGAARKTGFDAAKGYILFSTDADTILPPNWLKGLSEAISKPGVAAVTGSYIIRDCSTHINFFHNLLWPACFHTYRWIVGNYWLSGFNSAIRADIYRKSGGFKAGIDAQEDSELTSRIRHLGKIRYMPEVRVISSGRRFRQVLIRTALGYLGTYVSVHWLKRQPRLSDVR